MRKKYKTSFRKVLLNHLHGKAYIYGCVDKPINKGENIMEKTIIVEVVSGVAGDCLLIDDCRIAGLKALGGGLVIKRWVVDKSKLLEAFKIKEEDL